MIDVVVGVTTIELLEGERELGRGVGDRALVDDEAAGRGRERDLDERRRGDVDQRVGRGRRARARDVRPAAGEEGERDLAADVGAAEPVADDAARRGEHDRRLRGVERHVAEAGAAEDELRIEVGDRRPVDGEAGRRDRERHVEVVAAVQRVDVDAATGLRQDEVGGRAEDVDLERSARARGCRDWLSAHEPAMNATETWPGAKAVVVLVKS